MNSPEEIRSAMRQLLDHVGEPPSQIFISRPTFVQLACVARKQGSYHLNYVIREDRWARAIWRTTKRVDHRIERQERKR